MIKSEPNYYSNINNDNRLGKLIYFLTDFPELYSSLEEQLRLLIQSKIDGGGTWLLVGWFIKNSYEEHIKSLDTSKFDDISKETFEYTKQLAVNNQSLPALINFGIDYFKESRSFLFSKNRFENFISVVANDFDIEQSKKLLEVSNQNHQIYQSWGLKNLIKDVVKKYLANFDLTQYPAIYPEED